VARWCSG